MFSSVNDLVLLVVKSVKQDNIIYRKIRTIAIFGKYCACIDEL